MLILENISYNLMGLAYKQDRAYGGDRPERFIGLFTERGSRTKEIERELFVMVNAGNRITIYGISK